MPFRPRKVHVVSHTHWDREWYLSFEKFRARLIDTVDRVLDLAQLDPDYHFQLAIEAGCNAYAAPLGFLEAGAARFAGRMPLILKLNNNTSLYSEKDPLSVQTGSVADALRLGCAAIGYTIYPGSKHSASVWT